MKRPGDSAFDGKSPSQQHEERNTVTLTERIHGKDRWQDNIRPLYERRGTPRWISRKIEREFRGEDGLPVQDTTYDLVKAA